MSVTFINYKFLVREILSVKLNYIKFNLLHNKVFVFSGHRRRCSPPAISQKVPRREVRKFCNLLKNDQELFSSCGQTARRMQLDDQHGVLLFFREANVALRSVC